MEKLPPEILAHIFSYLRAVDLVEVQDVCRLWNEVCQSSSVWSRTSYNPSRYVKDGDYVEKFLRRAPNLQSFLPEGGIDYRLSKLLMKYCPRLRKLSLNVGVLHKEDIAEFLDHYHGIEDLELVRFCYWWTDPPVVLYTAVKCCPSLKRLDLLGLCEVSTSFVADLSFLGNATHLTDLKITLSCDNYKNILNGIASCTNLETLALRLKFLSCDISWNFLESVPKLNHLSLLHLNSIQLLSLFKQNVSKLQYLKIYCYGLIYLKPIFTKCSSLKTLVFSHCSGLCDDQFKCNEDFQQLEYLTIDHCDRLTDEAILYVCECPNLRALELLHCAKLTDRTPIIVMNSKKLSRFIFKKYGLEERNT